MASVYQRPDRAGWFVDYTDEAGERVAGKRLPGVTTRRAAEAAAHDIQRAVDRATGRRGHGLPGRTIARDALHDWLDDREAKRSAATAVYYRKHARQFEEKLPLSKPLSALTPSVIARYHGRRAAETSKQTADKERVSLHAWLSWCRKRGLVELNAASAVDPFGALPNKREPVERGKFGRYLRALRLEYQSGASGMDARRCWLLAQALRLLWHTGHRIGGACSVLAAEVNVGARTMWLHEAPNKGGTREVAIPRPVLGVVRRLLEETPGPWLLSTSEGLPAGNALQVTRGHFQRAHPEVRGAFPHALRHTFASRAEKYGVDPVVRSKGFLGHETIQMTSRYSHRGSAELRDAHDKMASVEREERIAAVKPPGRAPLEASDRGQRPPLPELPRRRRRARP